METPFLPTLLVRIPPLNINGLLLWKPKKKGGRALEWRRGGVSFPESYLLWARWFFSEEGRRRRRRVDCNIESVTGRLAGAQLWGRSRMRTEGRTYALTAQDLRGLQPLQRTLAAPFGAANSLWIYLHERNIKRGLLQGNWKVVGSREIIETHFS